MDSITARSAKIRPSVDRDFFVAMRQTFPRTLSDYCSIL